MAAAARLTLITLTVCQLSVLAHKDCPVLVTGPDQTWTPARRLEWTPTATPTNHQFPDRSPGRSELSFSVQTALSGLEVQLFSARHPGGYLLQVDSGGWRVQRTFVGAVFAELASGPPPPGRVAAAAEWSSYAVSVSAPDTVRLQRLYDNGTREPWLELRHAAALDVDLASARVTPGSAPAELRPFYRDIGPVASGDWGFWKFDCSRFYYQTAELCHLWPSWPSDVPLRFRTLTSRINPITNVNVLISASDTVELHLLETSERFYQVTLTPSELTLGRAERGVPVARQVARACLTQQAPPPRFRVLWVSILHGFIKIGLENAQPCAEDGEGATHASATSETPLVETESATVALFSSTEEVTELVSEVTEVTSEVTEGMSEATEVTEGQLTATTPTSVRTTLLTWHDGLPYRVMSYGIRTPDDQGVWTVNCQPSPDIVLDEAKMDLMPTRGTSDSPVDPDRGADRRCRSQQPFLLATVVLIVVSVVLLLAVVLLVSALLGQRRRWSAELAAQRRLSLVSTDLFRTTAPAVDGDHEYAELNLYDSIRPMSLRPGESTFKPLRRPETPDAQLYEVPVFEETPPGLEETAPGSQETVPESQETEPGSQETEPESQKTVPESHETRGARETSVEPLPPPPEHI